MKHFSLFALVIFSASLLYSCNDEKNPVVETVNLPKEDALADETELPVKDSTNRRYPIVQFNGDYYVCFPVIAAKIDCDTVPIYKDPTYNYPFDKIAIKKGEEIMNFYNKINSKDSRILVMAPGRIKVVKEFTKPVFEYDGITKNALEGLKYIRKDFKKDDKIDFLTSIGGERNCLYRKDGKIFQMTMTSSQDTTMKKVFPSETEWWIRITKNGKKGWVKMDKSAYFEVIDEAC